MNGPSDATSNLVVHWWRIAFGAHLLYSGIAYAATGWVPVDMSKAHAGTGQFLIALDQTGLYACVKYFEILIGSLLVLNRAVPLALVVHMPVTMMIAYLNLVVQPYERQLFTGPQELGFHIPLLVAYGGYYAPFLRWRTRPWWLFANCPAYAVLPPQDSTASPESRQGDSSLARALMVIGCVSLLILLASWYFSPPDRQLVRRDWFPIIIATPAMLVIWWTSRRNVRPG